MTRKKWRPAIIALAVSYPVSSFVMRSEARLARTGWYANLADANGKPHADAGWLELEIRSPSRPQDPLFSERLYWPLIELECMVWTHFGGEP